jgi:hypothetical protein
MSIIKDIVEKHIREYDEAKTGNLEGYKKPSPPNPNIFTIGELYIIGGAIISELEGLLADKFIEKGR